MSIDEKAFDMICEICEIPDHKRWQYRQFLGSYLAHEAAKTQQPVSSVDWNKETWRKDYPRSVEKTEQPDELLGKVKPCPHCGKQPQVWLRITKRGKPILDDEGKQVETYACCNTFSVGLEKWNSRAPI